MSWEERDVYMLSWGPEKGLMHEWRSHLSSAEPPTLAVLLSQGGSDAEEPAWSMHT